VTERAPNAVAALLDRAVRAGFAPGLAAAWIRAGEPTPIVIVRGAAKLGPPEEQPATPATLWDLASLTKPLAVTTLALLARRDGLVDLDWPVARLVPELGGLALGGRTVLELLSHSSGLPAWAPLYALAAGRPERVVSALASLPLLEAGRHVVYSCPGFVLLGLALERAHGQRLDHLFSSRVAGPLGLGIGYLPAATGPLAGGAAWPAAERALVLERGLDPSSIPATAAGLPDDGNARFLGGAAGNAGLFGSAAEVVALASAFLHGGSLLSDGERVLATRNHTPCLEQARGLGWQLAPSPGCSAGPSLSAAAFGHTGFTGASVWVDPTRSLVLALLANRTHPGHRDVNLHPLRRRFHDLVVSLTP
jgi:CubicO group peptidase (beta-lactamase class C family)